MLGYLKSVKFEIVISLAMFVFVFTSGNAYAEWRVYKLNTKLSGISAKDSTDKNVYYASSNSEFEILESNSNNYVIRFIKIASDDGRFYS